MCAAAEFRCQTVEILNTDQMVFFIKGAIIISDTVAVKRAAVSILFALHQCERAAKTTVHTRFHMLCFAVMLAYLSNRKKAAQVLVVC